MKMSSANKFLFAPFLALAMINCSSSALNTTINVNASNINSNAAVIENVNSGIAAAAVAGIAPDALVADLYKQHDADKSPFFQTKNRALVDKYFTKTTANLIWKDAVDSKGEVGALGADPLYNAQDTDIKNFIVGQADIKNDKAEVPVTFKNFAENQKIIFVLNKENNVWKIDDIKYSEGFSLVSLLKENASLTSDDKSNDSNGEFEGKYQVGDTTCTVKPIKMAFEVKWQKGTGTEIFFFQDRANDKYIFASDNNAGKANVFSFDDENYNSGTFYRADGKEFVIKRIK